MAAEQDEKWGIPNDLRSIAEKSVEQARQAFESFVSTTQRAVSEFEGRAQTTQEGARNLGRKAMGFAEQNVASSFEHAQKLLRAKDMEEVLKLQGDYIRNQMQVLADQARELGTSTTQMAAKSTSGGTS